MGPHNPALHFTSLLIDLSSRPAGMPWPVYLCFEMDGACPVAWRSLVSSRLVTTVVPQLDASGFFPRPLCISPSEGCLWNTQASLTLGHRAIILLWPQHAMWHTHALHDIDGCPSSCMVNTPIVCGVPSPPKKKE